VAASGLSARQALPYDGGEFRFAYTAKFLLVIPPGNSREDIVVIRGIATAMAPCTGSAFTALSNRASRERLRQSG
jgi:hypothetical protein